MKRVTDYGVSITMAKMCLKEAYQMACDRDWDGAEEALAELVDYAVQARLSIKEMRDAEAESGDDA
jgi:hypothetical protein